MPNGHEYGGDEEPVEVGDLLTTAGVFLWFEQVTAQCLHIFFQ